MGLEALGKDSCSISPGISIIAHFIYRLKTYYALPPPWCQNREMSGELAMYFLCLTDMFSRLICRYNVSNTGRLTLEELKVMMEKLGAPQTHLGLKAMIKEVDEDDDGMISFREFMLIFRKAAAGELQEDSGLGVLAKQCEIDVDEVGVGGAKDFFEAKAS